MSRHNQTANQTIAFQGSHGAYSDMSCRAAYPNMTTLPCRNFEDAFAAVRDGRAALAMIPIDNTVAGRVADIHHLLPDSGLHIIGEHFQPVNHHLLGAKGAVLEDITHVYSHIHALNQCRKFNQTHDLTPVDHVDTAGAAKDIAEWEDKKLFLYYLPPYSPQLNMIERVWQFMKYQWMPLSAYNSFQSMRESVNSMLSGYGSKHLITFA